MSKSVSRRVSDYRVGKAHIDIYVSPEIKSRFVNLAKSYRLAQSELLGLLVNIGEKTRIEVNKRSIGEEAEALRLLEECSGDHDAAVLRLAQECRVKNPKFVYSQRPNETPEEKALRRRFARIRNKLLYWKKKASRGQGG